MNIWVGVAGIVLLVAIWVVERRRYVHNRDYSCDLSGSFEQVAKADWPAAAAIDALAQEITIFYWKSRIARIRRCYAEIASTWILTDWDWPT